MRRSTANPGELALIERIRAGSPTRNAAVSLGIGDDCAIMRPPRGHDLVMTTDLCLEGRHFRRDWHTPESAGHRCLARGLSDVAAMGGTPLAAFLSIALPLSFELGWLDGFIAGFSALAALHGVELAGGDTAQAPGEALLADIVLTGSVPRGRALRRSGAQPDDILYVSGSLGGSAVELQQMAEGVRCLSRDALSDSQRQSFPAPRLKVGEALLRRRMATACMDVSDGLSTDLHHLCAASSVGAEVDLNALPVAPGASLHQALHGGEDYELLFTATPATHVPRRIGGIAITKIGRVVAGSSAVVAIDRNGKRTPLARGGWEHFRALS